MSRMLVIAAAMSLLLPVSIVHAELVLENAHFRLVIGEDGTGQSLVDKATGEDYAVTDPAQPVFTIYKGENAFIPSGLSQRDDIITVEFANTDAYLQFWVRQSDHYIALTLCTVSDPAIDRVDLLSLRVRPTTYMGPWINIAYDDSFGICNFGGGPNVNARLVNPAENRPWIDLTTMAYRETGLERATAILIGCPDPLESFLDFMEVAEMDFALPAGARGRKHESYKYSYLWIDATLETIDEMIEWARRGGFRMILFSYEDFSGRVGNFDWRLDRYPNKIEDLKIITQKIRDAGFAMGMHIHYNKAERRDQYLTPIPDDRLHATHSFTLTDDIDETATVLRVDENPSGCTMDDQRRLLKVGKELVEYTEYTTEPPYEFRGCKRGALNSFVRAHPSGTRVDLLNVDTWPRFVRFDQNTDIQDETTARLAKIIAETGPYEMIYYDGAEDVHSPFWYHCANAKWRVYRQIKPEPFIGEAAAQTHFSWHIATRSNAYDSVRPSEMKDFIRRNPARRAEQRAPDFSQVNFGWLHGFSRPDGAYIEPDILEFILSRGAAWDCPYSITLNPSNIAGNPRREDCFDIMKIWEDARVDRKLSQAQKDALKDLDQEHHLFINEQGEYELVAIDQVENVADSDAFSAFLFNRESDPGATYALIWHRGVSGEISLRFPASRMKLMRPMGHEVDFTTEGAVSTFAIGERHYLRFDDTDARRAATLLQRAETVIGDFKSVYIKVGDLVDIQGEIALGSTIGVQQEGTIGGDVLVPTGAPDMQGQHPWYADFTVDIPEEGMWYLSGRMWYKDTNTNSFHFSFPGIDDTRRRFGNSMVWDEWLWDTGGPTPLKAGPVTLRIAVREALANVSPLLDMLCLSNNPAYRPTDQNARKALEDR